MKVEIRKVEITDPLVDGLIADPHLRGSEQIWAGLADGRLVVVWGLLPPTLLSDEAYLWSYATEEVSRCRKTFVKLSRMAVEQMLNEYPTLWGWCKGQSRWLQWLGAEFGAQMGEFTLFTIRA